MRLTPRPMGRIHVLPILAALLAGGAGAGTAAAVDDPGAATEPLAVAYTQPPPVLDLQPYATVEFAPPPPTGGMPPAQAAVLADGGVVLQDDANRAVYLVGRDGSKSGAIAVDDAPFALAATAGPVLYGFITDEAGVPAIGAIALAGPNTGHVVASRPIDDVQRYLEIPATLLGNSPEGVIDRDRIPGARLMDHVDVNGSPVSIGGLRQLVTIDDGDVVRDTGSGRSWALTIDRHPRAAIPFAGEAPPAPSADGLTVYWTAIGPPPPGEEPGLVDNLLPVIAVLRPDGSGTWYSIPDPWQVVASDTGGTIFVRQLGNTVELARLGDALQRPPLPQCDDYNDNVRYPLRRCDAGPAVRLVQRGLRATVAPELQVDGFFGPLTEQAVREFQAARGLSVDGLVGPRTWPALTAEIADGHDVDSSGAIDPWEITGVYEPSWSCAGDRCTAWTVVIRVQLQGQDVSTDPVMNAVLEAVTSAGYTGIADVCMFGAVGEALGADQPTPAVVVPFDTQEQAARARTVLADRGQSGTVLQLTFICD